MDLAPVVAALAEARECTARAEREAAAVVGRARAAAEAERADAASRLRATADAEVAELAARAAEEARLIRTRAAQRMAAVLDLVIAHVHVELSALAGDADIPLPTREAAS
jgi:hypothetical protein